MGQAIIYFFLGIIFIVIAINNVMRTGTVFNLMTILLIGIAVIDFVMGVRFLKRHLQKKQQES